jgi:DNA excision repair protein ERCC-4
VSRLVCSLWLCIAAGWGGHTWGFCDTPQYLSSGFSKVERVMRSLHVCKLYLWPRFHLSVKEDLQVRPQMCC